MLILITMRESLFKFRKKAFCIAAIYAAAGLLWIVLSDRIVISFTDDPDLISRYQTVKGFLFVLVTAVLVYFLSKSQLSKIYHTASQLLETEKKHAEELEMMVNQRTQELIKKNEELERNLQELERMNDLFVGREFRIKQLKDQITELEKRIKP